MMITGGTVGIKNTVNQNVLKIYAYLRWILMSGASKALLASI